MSKLILAACALAMAVPASAQEARPQIGLGISIVPQAAVASQTVQLYVPIQIAPQLRLEPSLGVLTGDRSDVTFGVGAFYVQGIAPPLDMYFGGRLALNIANANGRSGADVTLAGALGGEYYLVPKFSLGLEAQLGIASRSNVSGGDTGAFTTGLAFLRLYFQ